MYENDLHLQVASLKRLLITLYFLLLLGALAGGVQAKVYSDYESHSKVSGVIVIKTTAAWNIQSGKSTALKSKYGRFNSRIFSFNPESISVRMFHIVA